MDLLDACNGMTTVYNPEYVVSAKGKFLLTHNGYNFTSEKKTTRPDCVRTTWRCTIKGTKLRKGCRATATSVEKDGVVKAVFKGVHCHAPQIAKTKAERLPNEMK